MTLLIRGENHQTLSYGRTKDVEGVIGMFLYQRDALDLNTNEDSNIDKIIDIPYDGVLDDQIKIVCDELGLTVPADEEYAKSLEFVTGYIETKKITVKQTKPKYYGVKINCDMVQEIDHNLSRGNLPPFWLENKAKIREWTAKSAHCTIVLRSKKAEHGQLVEFYDKMWQKAGIPNDSGELRIGAPVVLKASKIVYNDRVCAMVIDSSIPEFKSMNKHPHITMALLQEDARPVESNPLIESYFQGKAKFIEFPSTKISGNIAAFFS